MLLSTLPADTVESLTKMCKCGAAETAHRVRLIVLLVDSADEHVVRDVIQMAAVLQPRASHRDMVRGTLALGLDEYLSALDVLAVPLGERLE
jgi:hypothetical protein